MEAVFALAGFVIVGGFMGWWFAQCVVALWDSDALFMSHRAAAVHAPRAESYARVMWSAVHPQADRTPRAPFLRLRHVPQPVSENRGGDNPLVVESE